MGITMKSLQMLAAKSRYPKCLCGQIGNSQSACVYWSTESTAFGEASLRGWGRAWAASACAAGEGDLASARWSRQAQGGKTFTAENQRPSNLSA